MLDTPVTIAHAIQLAVAPVFLLTGISAMLAVFSGRLSRVSDRAREIMNDQKLERQTHDGWASQLTQLKQRSRLLNMAATMGTVAALFVSLVIAVIFIGFVMGSKTSHMVAALFVAATIIFSLSLLFFLREIQLGSRAFSLCEVAE